MHICSYVCETGLQKKVQTDLEEKMSTKTGTDRCHKCHISDKSYIISPFPRNMQQLKYATGDFVYKISPRKCTTKDCQTLPNHSKNNIK